MPYLQYETVRRLNITPGAVISGSLTRNNNTANPHVEDASYGNLTYEGPASGEDFLEILERSSSEDICAGFEYNFQKGQKFIPFGVTSACSIVTLEVAPENIVVLPNPYDPPKLKLSLSDSAGLHLANISITDLGFHEFALGHHGRGDLAIVNEHLRTADRVFVRLGVGRRYCQPNTSNDGYWLQANGIYTFPSKLGLVRGYRDA